MIRCDNRRKSWHCVGVVREISVLHSVAPGKISYLNKSLMDFQNSKNTYSYTLVAGYNALFKNSEFQPLRGNLWFCQRLLFHSSNVISCFFWTFRRFSDRNFKNCSPRTTNLFSNSIVFGRSKSGNNQL